MRLFGKAARPASTPCPACGAALALQEVGGKGKSFRSTMRQAVAVAQPTTSQRAPDKVNLRLRQAVILGGLVVGMGAIIPLNLGKMEGPILCGGLTVLTTFAVSTVAGTELLKLAIDWAELRLRRDLDGDKKMAGLPLPVPEDVDKAPPAEINISVKSPDAMRFLHFDAAQTKRAEIFAQACIANSYATTEKFYVGRGLAWHNGSGDSGRDGWAAFKAGLVGAGLAYEDGRRWHLKSAGRRAMQRIAAAAPPTLAVDSDDFAD